MPNLYAVLADVTVTVHAAFVAFVIVGQMAILIGWIKGWGWTRHLVFRAAHLAAIGFVVLESWFDIPCSLTVLENALRARSGLQPYEQTFIGYWLERLLYYSAPSWVFTLIYTLLGALTLAVFFAYPPRRDVSKRTRRHVQ
jgi:hypothetical protein